MRFVIIGSGPAGVCAAEAIRRRHPQAPVVMVSKDPAPAGSPVMLTYWLSGKYDARRLYFRDASWADQNRILLKTDDSVVSLDPSAGRIVLKSAETLSFDRLLIASGTSATALPVPGRDAEGVGFFRHLHDARAFLKNAADIQQIAIIGAGFIGLKLACHLIEKRLRVILLEREPRLAARIFDDETSRRVEKVLHAHGIGVHTGVEAVEVLNQSGRVSGVRLADGRRFDCQRIVQAVGVQPNVHFLKDSGIELNRGIIVNDRMQTNLTGIYAAGDVTVTIDSITGRTFNNATWPAASRQGAVAGCNMAGGSRRYLNNFPVNALDLFGLRIMAAGHPLTGADAETAVSIQSGEQGYRKTVTRSGHLVGFILVGNVGGAGVLLNALKSNKKIAASTDGGISLPQPNLPPNLGYRLFRPLF